MLMKRMCAQRRRQVYRGPSVKSPPLLNFQPGKTLKTVWEYAVSDVPAFKNVYIHFAAQLMHKCAFQRVVLLLLYRRSVAVSSF